VRNSVARALALLAAGIAVFAVFASAAVAAGDPVSLSVQPVALERADPPAGAVGRLLYRGGVKIASPDKRFGGFSGLVVSEDGRHLLAISDIGDWLSARLLYDRSNRLSGIAEATMGRLTGLDGRPLPQRPADADAESLTALPNGDLIVTFERQHRIWRYPASKEPFGRAPHAIGNPPLIETAPRNEGMEAFTVLSDGTYLVIAEGLAHPSGGLMAWRGDGTTWRTVSFARHGMFQPTDAKTMPNGDVMVLERRYNPIDGVGMRLRLIPRASVESGAELVGDELAALAPPMTVDNFEGLALRRGENETLIYVLSDDNFSAAQSTLLLMFALPDQH
jgi:hypothetical protein